MEKAAQASLGSVEEERSFHFSTGQWEEEKEIWWLCRRGQLGKK